MSGEPWAEVRGTEGTHRRNVSRHTASRYGRAESSSYGISSPYCSMAARISARSLSWTSGCSQRRCRMRESPLDVVSAPANVKVLVLEDRDRESAIF